MRNSSPTTSHATFPCWAAVLLLASSLPAATPPPTFLPGQDPRPATLRWQPVPELSDEFNASGLDRAKWQDQPVGNGWNWYGRAPGLFHERNVPVQEGELRVTVSKLDQPLSRGGKSFTHQGAIVRSIHPGQPGWYFETRMKANATVMSSTFWLVTKPGGRWIVSADGPKGPCNERSLNAEGRAHAFHKSSPYSQPRRTGSFR